MYIILYDPGFTLIAFDNNLKIYEEIAKSDK